MNIERLLFPERSYGKCLGRTGGTAGSAADTEIGFEARRTASQSDRSGRTGARTLAALLTLLIDEAHRGIKLGFGYRHAPLDVEGKRTDSSCRADIAASVAVVAAEAAVELQSDCSRAVFIRNDDLLRTRLDAEQTSGAFAQETLSVCRSRGIDEVVRSRNKEFFPESGTGDDHTGNESCASPQGAFEELPAADGGFFLLADWTDRFYRTGGYELHTAQTAFIVDVFLFNVDTSGRTGFDAFFAVDTAL